MLSFYSCRFRWSAAYRAARNSRDSVASRNSDCSADNVTASMGFEREAVQKPCPETEALSSIPLCAQQKHSRPEAALAGWFSGSGYTGCLPKARQRYRRPGAYAGCGS